MLDCWYYDVDELRDPEKFSRGMDSLVWESRREKVMRFRFGSGKRLCLGAGLLAAYALRNAGVCDLRIVRDENDKPSLQSKNQGIHFNISHSGHFAVCAVSKNPVGADVETLRRIKWNAARYCFSDRELEYLYKSCEQDRDFTRLWTRKESYLKMSGEGLSRDAKLISVLPDDINDTGAKFTEWEISGHFICVCSCDNDSAVLKECHIFK